MSTIIVAPHPTLRQKAQPVKMLDAKIKKLISDLGQTLAATHNPPGVGLAAPQIDKSWQIFYTYLPDPKTKRQKLKVYINPQILDHAQELILGEKPKDKEPRLEGCLSIPKLYGAVPRYSWIDLRYQQIQNDQLVEERARFYDFEARVIQHEHDHLNGILFTDHSVVNRLKVWRELPSGKMEEVDPEILKIL